MTVVVGIGQSLGPVVAGWISDITGLIAGLTMSPIALIAGGILALRIKQPTAPTENEEFKSV